MANRSFVDVWVKVDVVVVDYRHIFVGKSTVLVCHDNVHVHAYGGLSNMIFSPFDLFGYLK